MVKKKTMGSLYFNDHPVAVGSKYDGQELSIGNTVPGEEITWVEVNGMRPWMPPRKMMTYGTGKECSSGGRSLLKAGRRPARTVGTIRPTTGTAVRRPIGASLSVSAPPWSLWTQTI